MNADGLCPCMLMRKCVLTILMLMLVILILILMLLNLNTGYAVIGFFYRSYVLVLYETLLKYEVHVIYFLLAYLHSVYIIL